MSTLIRSAVVFTITAASLAAQIISPLPPIRVFQQVQTFGMVGLAEGQTARLNVLSPGVPSPAATGAMCSALLTFFDDQGASLKSATVTVIPGKSDSYDLDSDKDLKLAVNQRRQIRATIQIPPVVPPPGSLAPQFIPCTGSGKNSRAGHVLRLHNHDLRLAGQRVEDFQRRNQR